MATDVVTSPGRLEEHDALRALALGADVLVAAKDLAHEAFRTRDFLRRGVARGHFESKLELPFHEELRLGH